MKRFIEKTCEFELLGPGTLGCTCTPKIGYFQDKNTQKFLKPIFERIII